jgi:hypothetical protein
MLRQNNDFWRNNINYQNARIADPAKIITNDPNNFDQWSSYFIQGTYNHASVSFKGEVDCADIGSAGLRTENDGSVDFRPGEPTQVWSSKAGDNFDATDLLDNNNRILNAIKPPGEEFINRNNISLNLIISVKTYVLFDIFSFILYFELFICKSNKQVLCYYILFSNSRFLYIK